MLAGRFSGCEFFCAEFISSSEYQGGLAWALEPRVFAAITNMASRAQHSDRAASSSQVKSSWNAFGSRLGAHTKGPQESPWT